MNLMNCESVWPRFDKFPLDKYPGNTEILLFVDGLSLYVLTLALQQIKPAVPSQLKHLIWKQKNTYLQTKDFFNFVNENVFFSLSDLGGGGIFSDMEKLSE